MAGSPTTEAEIHQLPCTESESDPKLHAETQASPFKRKVNGTVVLREAPSYLSADIQPIFGRGKAVSGLHPVLTGQAA